MIVCKQLFRQYEGKVGKVDAVSGINLEVSSGSFVLVQGPSGSGKSTLLTIMGGMLRPTSGKVLIDEVDLYSQDANWRNQYRASKIGFVFQLFHLMPYLSVRENVLIGAHSTTPNRSAPDRLDVDKILDRFGLSSRAQHLPNCLSAGERQRVALARAIIKQPAIILADEPTGNLDSENARQVLKFLKEYQESGGTVVMVSHAEDHLGIATKVVRLCGGRIRPGKTG